MTDKSAHGLYTREYWYIRSYPEFNSDEAVIQIAEIVRRKQEIQPKKIMSSDARRQLMLEAVEEAKITNRVFLLMDNFLGTRPKKNAAWGVQAPDRAPEWMRPIAALSFKLGPDAPEVREACKAGAKGDWTTVEMILMAYQD